MVSANTIQTTCIQWDIRASREIQYKLHVYNEILEPLEKYNTNYMYIVYNEILEPLEKCF